MSRPVFVKLENLYEEIRGRGGTISLALVSRTVKRLEEDNITRPYEGNKVRRYEDHPITREAGAIVQQYFNSAVAGGAIRLQEAQGNLPDLSDFLALLREVFPVRPDAQQPILLCSPRGTAC